MDTHSLENYGADGVPIVPLDVRERLFEEIPEPIDTPHFHTFQRVVITDADRSMDWDSDKIEACKRIKKCLGLREKWMGLHPSPPQDVVDESLSEPAASPPNSPTRRTTFDLAGVKVTYRRRRELEYEFFDSAIPSKTDEYSYKMVDGVVHVFETERNGEERVFEVPDFSEYVKDYEYIRQCAYCGPCNSFSFTRLEFLAAKFNMHCLLNGSREADATKAVQHRDFYNIRKVDTHVHHSACMNQKHLLRFIKSKLKNVPNEIVITGITVI